MSRVQYICSGVLDGRCRGGEQSLKCAGSVLQCKRKMRISGLETFPFPISSDFKNGWHILRDRSMILKKPGFMILIFLMRSPVVVRPRSWAIAEPSAAPVWLPTILQTRIHHAILRCGWDRILSQSCSAAPRDAGNRSRSPWPHRRRVRACGVPHDVYLHESSEGIEKCRIS